MKLIPIHIGRLLLLFVIFNMLQQPCHAAYFGKLSLEDGLSQGSIYSMGQDSHGFIWIGTSNGLNRYDGMKVIFFKSKADTSGSATTLTGLKIDNIITDSQGNLWISTNPGFNFFDTSTYQIKQYFHDPNDPYSLPHNSTNGAQFDSEGYLWLATGSGLSRFDPKTEQFNLYLDKKSSKKQYHCSEVTNEVAIDSNNNIWVGSAKTLCKFNPLTNTFTLIDYRQNLSQSAATDVVKLIYNQNEGLWIATVEGLYLYNPDTKKSTAYLYDPKDKNSIPHNWLSDIAESLDKKYLWVATIDGLGMLNKKTGKFTNYRNSGNDVNGLSSNEIFKVFVDQSGLVWIGTNGSGINIYNPRQQVFKRLGKDLNNPNYSLSSASIWEITKAFGYIWVGTSNGLNRYDPSTGKIKQYLSDPNNTNSLINSSVVDIKPGSNRDLWISTWDGVSHFYIDEGRFENYRKQINKPETYPLQTTLAMHYDKNRELLWLGSSGFGVAIFNPETNQYTLLKNNSSDNNSLLSNYISHIYQASDNTIWFGTRSGVTQYNPENNSFNHIKHNGNNIGRESYSIKEMNDNKILIASENGLYIINQKTTELVKSFSIKDGLADDYIYSAEIDNAGYIWVGTNHSLSRINPKTNEINNFDITDGLQGNEFNGDASFNDGEYLYFGGYNGFNFFKPETIYTSGFITPVAITQFSIHNKPLNSYLIKNPLKLSYKDSFFSIEFAALDFSNPKKNQYAYMLEGFDQNWIYSKNRNFASYTNLDGGEYTFRVKAANKYGIWNEQGVSIPITITPPFWKTLWFRITSILLIIVMALSMYTYRVNAIKARNKLLKEEVKARTIELEHTLVELGNTKDALIDAAHKAGMTDTATGVLHNVGNILNNVITSAGLIKDTLARSTCNKFFKANQLLRNNIDNINEFICKDDRGVKLLNYYLELEQYMQVENQELEENATRLIEKITSIDEVISAQQKYVHNHSYVEELSLQDIIEDTILLQTGSIERHEISIEKKFEGNLPNVALQKIKLVQILLILYTNAKESMDANKLNTNRLILETSRDNKYAYIKVSDTGMGIEKNQLEKIFAYGFSNKNGGKGFGLHNCANYMTEMGGKIWAESDGYGQGATFILRFPLKSEDCLYRRRRA